MQIKVGRVKTSCAYAEIYIYFSSTLSESKQFLCNKSGKKNDFLHGTKLSILL